ncbi:MAG: ABC transporter ATP-binding protein [Candidatus Omnitrophota bacterium]
MSLLEVSGLDCGYAGRSVLCGIDFRMEKGDLLGVIGPNGSGKTTLLRVISQVIPPLKGGIALEGRPLRIVRPKELAKSISVVSQNPPASELTVEEFVLLGRTPHYSLLQFFETKKDLGAARRAMELTGIVRFKDRPLDKMSGGERQLVLIARALAQEPKILLLDEPTAHLDITHQVTVLDLIRRLNKELGLAVLMVMHDLNLAATYCRKLIMIDAGRIRKFGYPHEIFNYRDIEEVYRTEVLIERNPISLKPCIMLLSEEDKGGLRWKTRQKD